MKRDHKGQRHSCVRVTAGCGKWHEPGVTAGAVRGAGLVAGT